MKLPTRPEDGLPESLERLFEASQLRNQLIIDSTPVAICITDSDGIYEYVNPRYEGLTGYAAAELIGRSFTTVVPDYLKAEMVRLHDEFMGERHELSGQWEIVDREGRTIPILANAAYVIDVDGQPKKVTFVVDMSEIKEVRTRLEAEVEERRRVERMRDDVERVLRHDLRNPIDGIRTAADYLLQEDLSDRAREFVRLMYEAAVRARSRIDNSLAYTALQRGEYQIARERVNAVQMMRDVALSLRDVLSAYRTTLEMRYRTEPLETAFDVELWGEHGFLLDAVTNLARNAVEAGGEGDVVTVEVDDRRRIEVGGSGAAAVPAVAIAIHNRADIPAEVRDAFFDPYVTSGKRGGTGLGTYTAFLVAKAHRGRIDVETGGGSGTTVTLLLPRARPGEEPS
jgi:PAS domain S-box-containing protein